MRFSRESSSRFGLVPRVQSAVFTEMRPSMRFMGRKNPSEAKNVQQFLRTFLDKNTRSIRLEQIYAVIKGAGLKHQLLTLQRYFESFPTRTPGILTEEQFLRLISREERRDLTELSGDQYSELFNFFDCHSAEGRLTPEKLKSAAEVLGVQLPLEEAALMIKNFARNKKVMDKQDFVNMLSARPVKLSARHSESVLSTPRKSER